MLRHTTFFIDSVETIDFCGSQMFGLKGSEFELPFETNPTKGDHDYNNCEGCQGNLNNLFNSAKIKFDKFPFCCAQHANLIKAKWFNKNDFTDVPMQVAKKVVFTNQHIINHIKNEDWFNEITNYIDYTIESFGKMPLGYGEPFCLSSYLHSITNFLQQKDETTTERQNRILEYLGTLQNPKTVETDFNIIVNTYQKWLKIFPFETSYFKNLKQKFEKNLPILNGPPINNPYLGLAKAKLQTQSGLIESLTNITKRLLSNINAKELIETGVITDNLKHAIDLLNEAHKIKQNSLLGNYVKGEIKYINILKTWLNNEKMYFKEINNLLNTNSEVGLQDKKETKAEKLRHAIEEYGFFDLELIKSLSPENQYKLIDIIVSKKLPYQIAMFDFLGFISLLENRYFTAKYRLNKEISKWLGSDKDGRSVKANISSLLKNTTENKSRYTAYKHKQIVKQDYQNLK